MKTSLLGPNGNANCDGSGVISGDDNGYGFAVINYDQDTNTVLATVSGKALEPNTTYNVELIQGIDDCYMVDGTLTTNGQGKGNVHVSEESVSGTAVIAVCSQDGFVGCAGSSELYVTETYNY